MYCWNCSSEVKVDQKYCGHCGAKLVNDNISHVPTSISPQANNQNTINNEPRKYKKNGKRKLAAAIAIVCVLVAIVGIAAVAKSTDGENTIDTIGADELLYTLPEAEHVAYDTESGARFIDNEVILYKDPSCTEEEFDTVIASISGEVVGRIAKTNSFKVRLPISYTYAEIKDFTNALENSDAIASAFVNYAIATETAATSDDPVWRNKKHAWSLNAIDLANAWEITKGNNEIVVGVLDNQFFESHEDLTYSNTIANDFANEDNESSHGTHVSGIVSANENSKGVVGIAPGCSLVGFSTSSANISDEMRAKEYGSYLVDDYLYEYAISYLVIEDNAKVINISLAADSLTFAAANDYGEAREVLSELSDHLGTAISRLVANGYDFVIAKAAGNQNDATSNNEKYMYVKVKSEDVGKSENEYLGYIPYECLDDDSVLQGYDKDYINENTVSAGSIRAEYDYFGAIENETAANRIIVVGAAESVDVSNNTFGLARYSCGGERVDIIAPGSDIYSTVAGKWFNLFGATSYYSNMSGTSMASPMVAGVAALIYSANENLNGEQVKEIICDTASGIYSDIYTEDSDSYYGLLNAGAAVREAADYASNNNSQIENDLYAQKCKEYLDTYGQPEIVTWDSGYAYEISYLRGFCFADLLDFNGDGNDELLVAYCASSKDEDGYLPSATYMIDLWTIRNSELEKLFSNEGFGTNGGCISLFLSEYDGKWHIVHGSSDGFCYYYVQGYDKNGEITLTSIETGDRTTGAIDGKQASESELNKALEQVEEKSLLYPLIYYGEHGEDALDAMSTTFEELGLGALDIIRSKSRATANENDANTTGVESGQTIQFGKYRQGANGEVQPIDWIVVETEGDQALLVSEKILECMPMCNSLSGNYDPTWEKSSVREWLNAEFIKEAFSTAEASKITNTELANRGGDKKTVDKVFLLSDEELLQYTTLSQRKAKFTEYVKNQEIMGADSGYGYWWLRTYNPDTRTTSDDRYFKNVFYDGDVNDLGYIATKDDLGIRPAMWVTLK